MQLTELDYRTEAEFCTHPCTSMNTPVVHGLET